MSEGTATLSLMGLGNIIDREIRVDESTNMEGIMGLGAIEALKQKLNTQIQKKLKVDSLLRPQKLFFSHANEFSPETQLAIKAGKYRIYDQEFYLARFIATSGDTVDGGLKTLLKPDSEQIDGITNFQKNAIPEGMTALVTSVGVEVGTAVVSTFAAAAGVAYTDEKAPAFVDYDSTALLTSPISTPTLTNPTRRWALPPVLMNSKLEIRLFDRLVFQQDIRKLTNSGGIYGANRGTSVDAMPLLTPFLIKSNQRIAIDIKLPNNGKWTTIDEDPTDLTAPVTFSNGHFFVKIKLNTIALSITD